MGASLLANNDIREQARSHLKKRFTDARHDGILVSYASVAEKDHNGPRYLYTSNCQNFCYENSLTAQPL